MRGSTADGQEVPAQLVLGLGDGLVRADDQSGFERDRKFELRVVSAESKAGESREKGVGVGEKLSTATTLGEASAIVEESFKAQIAAAIGVDVDEVDGQKPLPEFGGEFPEFFPWSLNSSSFLLLFLISPWTTC